MHIYQVVFTPKDSAEPSQQIVSYSMVKKALAWKKKVPPRRLIEAEKHHSVTTRTYTNNYKQSKKHIKYKKNKKSWLLPDRLPNVWMNAWIFLRWRKEKKGKKENFQDNFFLNVYNGDRVFPFQLLGRFINQIKSSSSYQKELPIVAPLVRVTISHEYCQEENCHF